MLTGTAVTAGGMYWFSHISAHTSYLGGLLGPSLITGVGLGLLFVPLSLVTLAGVRDEDSGLASSLLSTGQQVGGATGLAVLGTVAWTVVANSLHSQTAHVARAAAAAGRPGHTVTSGPAAVGFYHQALAAGVSRGLLAASGIALGVLLIAVIMIRGRQEDSGGPEATNQPGRTEAIRRTSSFDVRGRDDDRLPAGRPGPGGSDRARQQRVGR
jgi:hypothetical protein